jgi:tetratricopeptide (TPR) repeat protein
MVRHALDRDPLSIIINASLGWILHGSGRHDEAIEQFIKTIDMDPTFARTRWSLGLAYAERGLFDEAIEELRQGVLYSAGSTYVLAALGHVYGRAGRFAEAREVLDQMTDLAGKQYVSPADFALVYAGLNDLERAIDALEKALADRSSDVLLWARSSRVFELLEHDPRYGAALKKMGLLQ